MTQHYMIHLPHHLVKVELKIIFVDNIKRNCIHFVTDDGLYDQEAFYIVKIAQTSNPV